MLSGVGVGWSSRLRLDRRRCRSSQKGSGEPPVGPARVRLILGSASRALNDVPKHDRKMKASVASRTNTRGRDYHCPGRMWTSRIGWRRSSRLLTIKCRTLQYPTLAILQRTVQGDGQQGRRDRCLRLTDRRALPRSGGAGLGCTLRRVERISVARGRSVPVGFCEDDCPSPLFIPKHSAGAFHTIQCRFGSVGKVLRSP
jgi:hypothetical protein